ncbi:SDR family NAD(P)-dependent oxidoreductase [Oerskovia paurometabola]|uniref:SDR family NAD(P)-dependent oxidoreductase n=1 Tax=Oerskovia paurometabola TaxID=162170 RepID=A0ABW1XDI7_9CELL|nr:SDR family oxidoreductase [Oerskovia paurometabola]MBM7497104.1 NAD(P)-dependent dehydrogenase (short-subunit alcohol dehydrogenase family) [Oerskovia paurometabola]
MADVTTVAPARTALVTGGARGIGRAVVLGLARAGLDVAVLGRDASRVDDVAAQVRALGRRSVGLVADVGDPTAVDAAVARAEAELGGIDLLVNNAGRIDAEVPLWEADPDEWWSVMETNVRGPFLLARALVPGMLARGGGRVVDLSSGAGSHDMDGATAYNASKTALLRIGSNLHLSGHARGLRTFEVSPGVVQTDLTASMDMHVGRTEWTPVERTVEMIVAIAAGELDAWSGTFVRVTHDSPASLRAAAAAGSRDVEAVPGPEARRLRVTRFGDDDPMPGALPAR